MRPVSPRRSVLSAALAAALVAPLPVLADAALILVESDYETLNDVPGANQAAALAQLAEDKGFDVSASLDQTAREASRTVAAFRRAAEDGERVLILVSGHVVSDGTNTWLLTSDAEEVSRFNVGSMAVPLDPLMELAADFPGQAVVMIAASGEHLRAEDLTPIGTMEALQGVTVITGPLDGLTRLTREALLVPGLPLDQVIEDAPRGVIGTGYISTATSFLPSDGERVVIERTAQNPEAAFWLVAQTLDEARGYELYLEQFPEGPHAEEARAALGQIEDQVQKSAELTETGLGLNQAARRQVQRNLSLLGFDPKGIDGIFGPGTRAAITAYQTANGHEPSGYLTQPVLAEMTAKADQRAAELEREAERRRLVEERRDRAYWDETGSRGDEAGLRAYLDRYPDGLFAEVTQERLGEIEADKRASAEADERSFWDSVRQTDAVEGYTSYLTRYPEGLFAEDARARLAALEVDREQEAGQARARAEEDRVAGNRVTMLLVETKLQSLGYELRADGQVDSDTRRAIRRFQNDRGLPVTGYVTQDTMVRLLAAF
ncbi:peptidoglycan-binding protein [Maritimibacter sp. DP1N21-5]|uniref:peptidoglycan-binding domain-containing protein n=1 Tax=Maritimibacter sp. DP1N21-5 TaxID=2836867 RepID=UPI001C46302A|nr:peptidoglycan-binding protein [Maritimibacter sp. DP1N21-5]MBV7407891.1 peptidoglycan-binding protein [Maritimibacter sp. DP1N21-5]